tara:strand:- start:156 stop:401 length:246 start_codon:yes stop_codon:yes gene_type:complete
MGASQSKWVVHDWSVNRNMSQEHRISAWEELEPKNSEYYDGTRFFKVSRRLYPSYTKGWIYGYDHDSNYWYDSLITPEEEY